ncbi:16S rRNA G966 N2-methylase RsmD [Siphonobacter sp. BAB-5404]|nr:16S rRNA G966 N2-methylase RsmD [Siphonobacter sp. SORGH_AS_0500]
MEETFPYAYLSNMSLISILTQPEVRSFIAQHQDEDWQRLLLSAHRFPGLPIKEIALQIQCRQKAKGKLPSWLAASDVLFPGIIPLEQCSSERTARWKSSLMRGDTYADLTGGMGVDFWAASANFRKATYCEQQADLFELTKWNLPQVGLTAEVNWVPGNGVEWLKESTEKLDWLYLDPARRNQSNQKMVYLSDCEPNVLEIRDLLLEKANNVLIKLSPMLDIDLAVKQLQCVQKVYVIAVEDEVKELLFQVSNQRTETEIVAVNLLKNNQEQKFTFTRAEEQSASPPFSQPLTYLYEPNAALLKAGAFKSIAGDSLYKLAVSSHLYTSDSYKPEFPGRIFKINAVTKADKKEIHRLIPSGKAHITVRNFPMGVADLRKKLSLNDGGEVYVFATSDENQKKLILVTEKVNPEKL